MTSRGWENGENPKYCNPRSWCDAGRTNIRTTKIMISENLTMGVAAPGSKSVERRLVDKAKVSRVINHAFGSINTMVFSVQTKITLLRKHTDQILLSLTGSPPVVTQKAADWAPWMLSIRFEATSRQPDRNWSIKPTSGSKTTLLSTVARPFESWVVTTRRSGGSKEGESGILTRKEKGDLKMSECSKEKKDKNLATIW